MPAGITLGIAGSSDVRLLARIRRLTRSAAFACSPLGKSGISRSQVGVIGVVAMLLDLGSHVGEQVFGSVPAESRAHGHRPPTSSAVPAGCGREHRAPRPDGVTAAALSIGPRLRALAVYLVIHQHVPVERCRQLLSDVTGADVSAGFVHSCPAKASALAAGTVALVRRLIAAAPVAGFGETTLRAGPAGEKKYVHGAFTKRFWESVYLHSIFSKNDVSY